MVSTSAKPVKGGKGDRPAKAAVVEPRPAPSFVSSLRAEETDFPRGGGTSLTALEVKQTRAEGRREAEAEAQAEASYSVAHQGTAGPRIALTRRSRQNRPKNASLN